MTVLVVIVSGCSRSVRTWKHVPVPTREQTLQLSYPFTIIYRVASQGFDHGDMDKASLQITLSCDGERLLYRSTNLTSWVTHTVLYDGNKTYEMDSNSRISAIEPGFDLGRMAFCPLPGVGLPHAPFFTAGCAF